MPLVDAHNLESIGLAVGLADGDVFALLQGMRLEMIEVLVVLVSGHVGIGPGPAPGMMELADLILFIIPEAADRAFLPRGGPPSVSRVPSSAIGAVNS